MTGLPLQMALKKSVFSDDNDTQSITYFPVNPLSGSLSVEESSAPLPKKSRSNLSDILFQMKSPGNGDSQYRKNMDGFARPFSSPINPGLNVSTDGLKVLLKSFEE